MTYPLPLGLLAALALVGCTTAEEAPDLGAHDYVGSGLPDYYENGLGGMPPGFQAATDYDNTPAENPVTNDGAALGRVLFYDTDLSQNRTISCASCHIQEFGFSDDAVLSEGFEGGSTGRHSMGLTNARFYGNGKFFWDQRAASLEEQVLMPMQDPVEMGMTLEEVVVRVQEDERYGPLFMAAYGDEAVDTGRISSSIAQFVRSMVSTTSPYDVGRAQVTDILDAFPNFTSTENEGKRLFYAPPGQGGLGCAHCHGTDAQIGIVGAISNGLDATTTDEGYGGVTEASADMGTFKVPSLRNVGVRAPYMHDGRFGSLEEVIEHYSSGIQYHPTLFPFLTSGNTAVPLDMTNSEKAAMLAFLNTLTDPQMLVDPKFSDPGW